MGPYLPCSISSLKYPPLGIAMAAAFVQVPCPMSDIASSFILAPARIVITEDALIARRTAKNHKNRGRRAFGSGFLKRHQGPNFVGPTRATNIFRLVHDHGTAM